MKQSPGDNTRLGEQGFMTAGNFNPAEVTQSLSQARIGARRQGGVVFAEHYRFRNLQFVEIRYPFIRPLECGIYTLPDKMEAMPRSIFCRLGFP